MLQEPFPYYVAHKMKTSACIVLTTFPDRRRANRMAEALLKEHLAACVQTWPIRSSYRWRGKICREPEVLMLIKTQRRLYSKVEQFLKAAHPYETPEIIQLGIETGWSGYLHWLAGETESALAPARRGGNK